MTHYSLEDDKHFHLSLVLGNICRLFFSLSHSHSSVVLYSLEWMPVHLFVAAAANS